MSKADNRFFVLNDAQVKLEKLITLLEEYSQNSFLIDRDESMNQSLFEAINSSLQITYIKDFTLVSILPRLLESYKIIKDENSQFVDEIANVIVETLSKATELYREQQISLLQEFSDKCMMSAEEGSILQDKLLIKFSEAFARRREAESEVVDTVLRPVARRREAESEVAVAALPPVLLREEKPFVKTGSVFVKYPDERPRRGADSLSVANFPHQDSYGTLNEEIAAATPVVEAVMPAIPVTVSERVGTPMPDIGLSPIDEEEAVDEVRDVAEEPAANIPARNMQPRHGFFTRLLRRCFPDRRVIPVGNPDDEGR